MGSTSLVGLVALCFLPLFFCASSGPELKDLNPRIIGGDAVPSPNPYPWVTYLRFGCKEGGGASICAGSAIGPNVVLTAAHCWRFECEEGGDGVASVGLDNENPDERISIKSWHGHPDYNPQTTENDIAVWILDGKFKKVDKWGKLPDSHVGVDDKVTAAGWGRVNPNTGEIPQFLREVDLEIQPNNICAQLFGGAFVQDTQICAGVDGEEKDTCNGDSGGPLFNGRTVHGLTSYGSADCGSLPGGVYTRVNSYTGWVRDTMDENGGIEGDDDDNSSIAWIVIGVVGGVLLIAALIGVFVFMKKRGGNSGGNGGSGRGSGEVPDKPGRGGYVRPTDQV